MDLSGIVDIWISDGREELSPNEYQQLIKNMRPMNITETLYRGLKIDDRQKIKPNKELSSWTYDKNIAETFGEIVLEWKPVQPILALDISKINIDEKEIIVRTLY